MEKFYLIVNTAFIQILYALSLGGCVIALRYDELVIALMCLVASSLLRPMWREVEREWKEYHENKRNHQT